MSPRHVPASVSELQRIGLFGSLPGETIVKLAGRMVREEFPAGTPIIVEGDRTDRFYVLISGLAGVLPGFGRQTPNDWGLGFELRGQKSPHWTGTRNSPHTYGHFGSKPGTATFLWVDPERGVACVALTTRRFGDWAKVDWPLLSDAVLAEVQSET